MSVIDWLLGTPLGKVLYFCYWLLGNYGLAIVVFTLFTKIVLFPLSMLAQKNAIIMARLKPQLEDIKRRFAGNSSLILEEQQKLYKTNHYSALKGSLPLLVQIPLILGVISVVYHPLKHVLGLSTSVITSLVAKAAVLLGVPEADLGYSGQTRVLELVQTNPDAFTPVVSADIVSRIQSVDLHFLGLNLGDVPSWGSVTMIWPIASALSALALCLYQNRYYVLQRFAGPGSRIGITAFMVAFSGYFAAILPGAFGLYWTVGNLLGIAVVWLCNVIDDPRKKVDYSTIVTWAPLSREERAVKRAAARFAAAKGREDRRLFRAAGHKEVIFYSEGSGFWKYFAGIINQLAHDGIHVHYVTSDAEDKVFSRRSDHLTPYYVGAKALIPFMMQLDADIVVMTLPDLEKYHIKRSLVRKDMEYIYLDHGVGSFHLMLREGALDHFDTIFCNGPNHVAEVRQTEDVYDLAPKKLAEVGFPLFDDMIASLEAQGGFPVNDPPVALIAPSWQPENILELCLDETVTPLVEAGFHVIVRPHPEFVKRFGDRVRAMQVNFADHIDSGAVEIQTDFSSSSTVYNANVLVTDWSTIAAEFCFTTLKPTIFINTPMKVMNHNWERIAAVPLEISLRDEVGVSLEMDDLGRIGEVARDMADNPGRWHDVIEEVRARTLFNLGHSAQAGATYIENGLETRRRALAVREAEDAVLEGRSTPSQEALLADEEARQTREEIEALRDQASELRAMADAVADEADAREAQLEAAHA
ncbi:MAG: YidC/Oxa1 family membrane protein insertase [Propionibacteriaceae bacterium]|nr:YidC/Oxa1 family membrane protein insertase [Propionibacteriaceae bacterium]